MESLRFLLWGIDAVWGQDYNTPPEPQPGGRGVQDQILGLSKVIKAKRMRKGISARTTSARAGLSPGFVNKLELGQRTPMLRHFAALAVALEFTDQEIIYCIKAEAIQHFRDLERGEANGNCGSRPR